MTEADLYILYKGFYIPNLVHSPESLKYYEEFSFRPDDVVIVTYPKSDHSLETPEMVVHVFHDLQFIQSSLSGTSNYATFKVTSDAQIESTTWMQEIVPLILTGGDPASVETVPNWDRAPWLEQNRVRVLNLEERPSPRILTTHFRYDMMTPSFLKVKPKVIYVTRNPKDVFISSFHYYGMTSFLVEPGLQSDFLQTFLDGKVMFGSWFDHVKSWLSAGDKHPIMYISYEEMIMDLKDSVTKIGHFLNKSLDSEVVEKIAERCEFKNMKQNKMSNYSAVPRDIMDQEKSEFLRKGITGDWKNKLTVAEAETFDAVYNNKMKDVKFKFVWD